MKTRFTLALLASLALPGALCAQPNPALKHRWFYLQTNLLTDDNVTNALKLMDRAQAAGYNGLVVTDTKFDLLDRMPPHYFSNIAQIKDKAKALKMGVYPLVCNVGYEGGALNVDPQLAEGIPARDVPFVARGGQLEIEQTVSLANGDFEQTRDTNTFGGWSYQDAPGERTFVDKAEHHGGTASLRMEPKGDSNSRVIQKLNVAPYQPLHLSVWIKTQDLQRPGDARSVAIGSDGKVLAWVRWNIARTQDWTRYDTTFSTGNNREVNVYLGVWGGGSGRIWWDDATIGGAALSNLVRRPGAPLSVKGEDGKAFTEGQDFEAVRDDKTGQTPWTGVYEDWHPSPLIKLMPGSRIKDGQRVLLSYYRVQKVDDGSVAPCLSEPKTYAIFRDQVKRVCDLWQPQGLFISLDEIRQMNTCAACEKRGLTSGQLLADATKKCVALCHEVRPGTPLWVWSDMFDPFHNAVDDYYLARGSMKGSWEGVPASVGVVNWNSDHRADSLAFFAGKGHTQVISGFYDSGPDQIKEWMKSAQGVKGVDGAMYTTWNGDYSQLESFAQSAWGGK